MQRTDISPGSHPQTYHYNIMNSNRAQKPFTQLNSTTYAPPPSKEPAYNTFRFPLIAKLLCFVYQKEDAAQHRNRL